ncbi:MAG: PilZ domain-containing protein [Myxococcota bacterium]
MSKREARRAAVLAARRAREHLAHAMGILQRDEKIPEPVRPFADYIATVVRTLFVVETESADGVRLRLDEAMTRLRHILHAMQEPTALVPVLQEATESVARSLAILHPARREFERALYNASEPVIPLSRRRETERRSAPRVAIEADIGLQSDTNFYTGFSGDLSDGGIFVATYNLLPIGTELTVSFVLPDGPQITAHGRVSWIREANPNDPSIKPGMGVAFEGLPGSEQENVLAFIERRAPLFYDR